MKTSIPSDDLSLDCHLPMNIDKYMVFMGKNYPINFKVLQIYSIFFSKNKSLMNQQFLIFNYPNFVTHYSFDSFINACQNNMFQINLKNAISLHYLSKRFEVSMLKNKVEEFIESNHEKLLIECLNYKIFMSEEVSKSIDPVIFDEFFNMTYEIETFGKSLNEYLEEENFRNYLLSLPIQILYKIIQHFALTHQQDIKNLNTDKIENNPIFDFLIEYIKKNGNLSSIIFSVFHFSIEDIERIESKKGIKIDKSFLYDSLNITKEEFINKDEQFEEKYNDSLNRLTKQIHDLQYHTTASKIIDNYIYQEMKKSQNK